MRTLTEVLFDKITMSGAVVSTSSVISLEHIYTFALQYTTFGTTGAGTIQMQVSCDPGTNGQGQGVTNWANLDTATTVPGTIGSGIINKDGIGYKWLRVIYTANSGTGTILVTVNTKGT